MSSTTKRIDHKVATRAIIKRVVVLLAGSLPD